MSDYTQNKIEYQTATIDITADDDLSDAIEITGRELVGIVTPSSLTSTSITFSVSYDGTNYATLYKTDGNALSITVSSSRHINVISDDLRGFNYFKLIMGSNESADRSIVCVTKTAT